MVKMIQCKAPNPFILHIFYIFGALVVLFDGLWGRKKLFLSPVSDRPLKKGPTQKILQKKFFLNFFLSKIVLSSSFMEIKE